MLSRIQVNSEQVINSAVLTLAGRSFHHSGGKTEELRLGCATFACSQGWWYQPAGRVNVRCWHERIVYSREALLNIEKAHHELKSDLFNYLPHLDTNYTRPARPRRRRGKRGGLHARLKARATRPPLPSLLLANVRSLENKMDELRARTTTQCEIRECCALIFTETWTKDNTPDSVIQLETHSVHRGDRTSASGKNKGGGVCVYINNRWCSDVQVVEKHCSVDIEVLMVKCRPFYLPREFSAVFILVVYIPPRADRTAALGLLHDTISKHETTHPDAVLVVAGDFNHCNLRTVLPKYHQHVSFPTMDNNILDHVYSNVKGTYKAAPRPHFRQSDHISMFLYPSYRQLLKQAPPVSKTVKVWNEESDLVLQDCFNSTDWDVFKTAAVREDGTVDLEEYASVVTGYISTCIQHCPHQVLQNIPKPKTLD
ncbi:hypothetical protein N1851_028397 [Merluccius polli]|uniref:Uncharacterized protein n=1 Tax=Merluccius polli TaxID=89951 RepID=A0AA47M8S7_MERPO|nr:hypothetical protein N1851_028397 [Merluccius polli]